MEQHVAEALRMLEAFVSVGAKRFSVTQSDIEQQQVRPYWPGLNVGGMRLLLAHTVPLSWERRQNLILRPRPVAGGVLAQLDDLDLRKLEGVRSRAFLTLETSPGNYQAWFFVRGGESEYVRQLVRRIQGIDWKASGATRVAGTPNCKVKYAPDFPVVRVGQMQLRKQVELVDFENFATPSAPPLPPRPEPAATTFVRIGCRRAWPSYEMCLARAPESSTGGKQRSMADFTWCCTAADWGWLAEDIARKLMEVSTKAQENGWEYARKTAERAVYKVVINGRWAWRKL